MIGIKGVVSCAINPPIQSQSYGQVSKFSSNIAVQELSPQLIQVGAEVGAT